MPVSPRYRGLKTARSGKYLRYRIPWLFEGARVLASRSAAIRVRRQRNPSQEDQNHANTGSQDNHRRNPVTQRICGAIVAAGRTTLVIAFSRNQAEPGPGYSRNSDQQEWHAFDLLNHNSTTAPQLNHRDSPLRSMLLSKCLRHPRPCIPALNFLSLLR